MYKIIISFLLVCVASLYMLNSPADGFIIRKDLKFKLCPNATDYDYNVETGTFLCIVPRASDCWESCLKVGCVRWAYSEFIHPTSEKTYEHYRCRCLKMYATCAYGLALPKYRGYED